MGLNNNNPPNLPGFCFNSACGDFPGISVSAAAIPNRPFISLGRKLLTYILTI
jgi:hypothetical protein